MNSWKTRSLSGISQHGKSDQRSLPENIRLVPLTQIAHSIAENFLTASSFAIDATLGNGHDTLFLAQKISSPGRIHGFDIQSEAISATSDRLKGQELLNRVTLHQLGHQEMDKVLPSSLIHNTSVIFFNLGYLPGGDKATTTLLPTTLQALQLSWHQYLSREGMLSIMLYPGHPQGAVEADGVLEWLHLLGEAHFVRIPSPGPVLILASQSSSKLAELMATMDIS